MFITFPSTCIPIIGIVSEIDAGEYPIAEDAYERLISLPMFHGMSDGDVEDVIRAVRKVILALAL